MRAGTAMVSPSPTRYARGIDDVVPTEKFDRDFWERRWAQALHEHRDVVAKRPPSTHLLTETGDLHPGVALDAGCGHGAETLWLAAHGWRVTAVDFAATALDHARSSAEAVGVDVAERRWSASAKSPFSNFDATQTFEFLV